MPTLPTKSEISDDLILSLIDMIENDDVRRGQAFDQLQEIGPRAEKAIPALARMLASVENRSKWYYDDINVTIKAIKGADFLEELLEHVYANKDLDDFLSGQGGPMSLLEKEIKVPTGKTRVAADPRLQPLDALLATVPKDAPYEEKAETFAGLGHDFRQRIAAELAPALNERIQGMPHETLEQKKEVARWVNAELERFGLAVKCPKTGMPAKLRGTTGNWPGVGRFTIEIYTDGKQKVTTVSDTLPELSLTDASPPKETEINWGKAVKARISRKESSR